MATAQSPDGCMLAWTEKGTGPPILLIHGFASMVRRNWEGTGWMDALTRAGYRAIAYDQRGHGYSDKRYDPADYAPERLVDDALAVLDAAGAARAAVMGYSMGARVALEVALTHGERENALILSGIGPRMRDFGGSGDRERPGTGESAGVGAGFLRSRSVPERDERELVALALEADDPSPFPASARFYRTFAEQNHQDRRALAACWRRPIRAVTADDLASIAAPTLITVGDRDTVAGDAAPLAKAIPGAELVVLHGKDHMTAVGAKQHREAVIAFLHKSLH